MTRDDAVKIILGRCGNRIGDTYLQQQCILEMAMKQQTVLEQADFKPWFLLSEYMHAVCGALEPRMPLPPAFLEEYEEGLLWIKAPGSAIYDRMLHDDNDVMEARFIEEQPGLPRAYSIVRDYIVLHPTPLAAYPMKMRCYLKEPTLTHDYEATASVQTNAWLTHAADWLIGETGKVIAGQYLKDEATAAKFAEEAMAARTRLYVAHVAREEMNRSRSQGDD